MKKCSLVKRIIAVALALTVLIGTMSSFAYNYSDFSVTADLKLSKYDFLRINELVTNVAIIRYSEQLNILPSMTPTPDQASMIMWYLTYRYAIENEDGTYQYAPYSEKAFGDEGLTKDECDKLLQDAIGRTCDYSVDKWPIEKIGDRYKFTGADGDPQPYIKITDMKQSGTCYLVYYTLYDGLSDYELEEGASERPISSGLSVVAPNPDSVFGYTLKQSTPASIELQVDVEVKVLYQGQKLSFDQPPVIVDSRTLVPLRGIFEAIGAGVTWDEANSTVTAVKDNTTIIMQIDNNLMQKNGEAITLDVSPRLLSGRTMVPVRAVADAFDAHVGWDEATLTVSID